MPELVGQGSDDGHATPVTTATRWHSGVRRAEILR